MNFTKDYIELCKDKRVQNIFNGRCLEYRTDDIGSTNQNYIWLPTGDQLDEEIIKICGEKDWDTFWYTFEINWHRNYTAKVEYYNDLIRVEHLKSQISSYEERGNPLIAKIKLLLELLNTNEGRTNE